ncbi:glycosyltransferase family 2 protein [Mucilaginibacter terrae]|uniref:Glycosyltransferase involved in cell wall biosynthesis n=1 Tax=Mucilaginibacter terrae TaxID=1955052 RepID=A0ABU3GVQ9_9SPHI|nr:glycosyltransferase family 2 protein [Mucilaginibacter terrae]MDT3403860.1 glycosyltransferase involved in cell wall biosynthesis [Mucilaginibacter terrae]
MANSTDIKQGKQRLSIGVLISTYNWPEALELVLMSLLRQTRMPDEIMIADDGSREETRQLIDRYRAEFNIPIHHAWQEDKGFRKCLALNKAVKMGAADYIIEIDGDIIVTPKFVADHERAARKGFFMQGSRAMLHEEKTIEILKSKQIDLSSVSPGVYSRFNAIRIPLLSIFYKPNPRSPWNVKGCNLAFWREDYIKVNGYYNDFEGWGWEDYEFAARLINAGILKKRLKMAAISYHIFHRIHDRENFLPNELIYRKTVAEKLTYCPSGYNEV